MPVVLLQEHELATAIWTGEAAHSFVRRPGAANKGFSMISGNDTLHDRSFEEVPGNAFTGGADGSARHHSSVGRAAAL